MKSEPSFFFNDLTEEILCKIYFYGGYFIITEFCEKSDKLKFKKIGLLIKSPRPFCRTSAETKSLFW